MWRGFVIFAAVVLTSACRTAPVAEDPVRTFSSPSAALVDRGREFAEFRCGSCHSISRGVSSRDAAAPPFETLYTRVPTERLGERIRNGLMVDHPRMPLLVRLSPDEEAALQAYVASVQQR